ncbi:AAA family ATPase [Paenibacillus rhizovicinus]|uniref:AAA family ATPase n=1 Tax=Paenibacillus rhizovicinus TaxID=2704463 RepID=A0A6C0P793_9BACL|nr:AAA family ATPase [Paenibacillus rhizovicinus]QHW34256.1 AAA family ATPase [Paenibacillus rhizovicinus]
MKFVLVFGPQAVGKMTIGHELEKITGLKLFHNHMTIELLHPFFGFSPETWRLSDLFRMEIFKAAAASGMDGLIFTYVWAFNQQGDWDYVDRVCTIIEEAGGEVYFVELEAELKARLARNRTPHRLQHKPTKRNVEQSEKNLLDSLDKHRLNSEPGEIEREHYLRIDNSGLSPEQAAHMIKTYFEL